jgi:nucleoside-diphosphate-sugar epimerase
MTILVTGGTGFVGLNVAEHLVGRGEIVVLLGCRPAPEASLSALSRLFGKVHMKMGDVRNHDAVGAVVQDWAIDKIVHCAVVTPDQPRETRDFRRIVDINVLGALTVMEVALDQGVRRVVYVSSAGVYGTTVEATVLDEACTVPNPTTVYDVTKLAAEWVGLRLRDIRGLDFVAARVGTVFGPWEHDTGVRDTLSPIFQVTQLARHGGVAFLPRPGRKDWIYSRDVAAAVVALLDARVLAHRTYNVALGNEWTVAEWCDWLVKRYPRFRYRIDPEIPAVNVDFYGELDRPPLTVDRIATDVCFTPSYPLAAAFDDYLAWLDRIGDPAFGA